MPTERELHTRKRQNSIHLWTQICVGIHVLSGASVAAWAQTTPGFSGLWKQDNDRCKPKRSGDVTLHVEHHGPEFAVETTILRASSNPRHAVQNYSTDGKVSISTGTDGDEFHTSVVWRESSLVFSIEEHEAGRILRSKETWSLIENGATLQSTRERADGGRFFSFAASNPGSTELICRWPDWRIGSLSRATQVFPRTFNAAEAIKRNWP